MKTYCKRVDPSDVETIAGFVYEALHPKLKRKDYSEFTAKYCELTGKQIRERAKAGFGLYPELKEAVYLIAKDISIRIRQRDLQLGPIRYETRTDGLSKKTRVIGIETVMQQVMEHVAVWCMKELWDAKYAYHQYASIKGKGQLRGAKAIQKWTKEGKVKYFVKLDVRKCFHSLSRKTAMKWLRRDIRKNKLLLWFVDALLKMHGEGLVIGSLLSQFLCNYFMSYGYRFVMGLHKERRGRKVSLCTCALFYMDDIFVGGTDRRNLVMAVRKLIRFLKASFGLIVKDTWHVRDHEDCGADMMGFVIRANGRIKIRPRVFIRARRAFMRSAGADDRLKTQRRVSAYFGFFKAAGIRQLRKVKEAGQEKCKVVSVHTMQTKAALLIAQEARREILCAA